MNSLKRIIEPRLPYRDNGHTIVMSVLLVFTLVLSSCTITVAPIEPSGSETQMDDASMDDDSMDDESMDDESMDDDSMDSDSMDDDSMDDDSMDDDSMDDESMDDDSMDHSAMMDDSEAIMTAGELRANLDLLLGEHVLLASSATEAALRGRQAEFEAAAAALDNNTVDLAILIGVVYGAEVEESFLALWRTHIGFFVDYTTAVATADEDLRNQALSALSGYGQDFGAFLESANPNLQQAAIAKALAQHVATLTSVIDAQGTATPQDSGDQQVAYELLRMAYRHMDVEATALASGISAQFPELFPADATSPKADLRSALNMLLAEHTYLVAKTTAAALDARNIEFEAAAGNLDENSQDLAAAVGSIYGAEAGDAFLSLWRKHIGFFIDYTLALSAGNEAGQQTALTDLQGYANVFGAFLNSANPDLPVDAVASLVATHAETTIATIDAAHAEDHGEFYSQVRMAYGHMDMIANALTDAIAAQFPDQFPEPVMEAMMDGEMMDEEEMAGDEVASEEMAADEEMMADGEAVMRAGQLRTALDMLLGEHVLLAASATGAAIGGRADEFDAAAAALDNNSVDLALLIGSVYGVDARDSFLALWRTHIGFFVDYTTGVATGDKEMAQRALDDLAGYGQDFGAFLESANSNLPQEAIAANLAMHVDTLTAAIDGQAAGDPVAALESLRAAYAHMDMTATALADGISAQFPALFPGQADSAAAGLRSALTTLLAEHTFLASMATGAAIDGRDAEFEATVEALDLNSIDLAAAVGSVYGDEAEDAFLPLWRTHIGFFVDYTVGAAAGDEAQQEAALEDLQGYRADFAAFLNSANPALSTDAVIEVLTPHVMTLTAVIGAQAEGDQSAAYTNIRPAYAHMQVIADALSDAIIAQFPEKFPVTGSAAMDSGTMDSEEMDSEAMADESMDSEVMADESMEEDEPMEAMSGTVEVDINTFVFSPQQLEVTVGTTIIWTNQDAINHTVTAGVPGSPSGEFDSGNFNQGETFSLTVSDVGEFDYFCARHPHMRGTIVVVAAQ